MMNSKVKISLLGNFEIRQPSGKLIHIPGNRGKALIAYLAVSSGQPVTRQQLAQVLWPNKPAQNGRTNLRKTLSRVSAALAVLKVKLIDSNGDYLQIALSQSEIDTHLFDEYLKSATPESLLKAINLYRGVFLQDFKDCGEEFEQWITYLRHHTKEDLLSGLHQLANHYAGVGAVDQAIHISLKLLAQDQLDERTHRMLIRLYLSQDRVGAASLQYRNCREILQTELGTTPSAETESLCTLLKKQYPVSNLEDESIKSEEDTLPEHSRVLETAMENRRRSRESLIDQASVAVLAASLNEVPEHLLPLVNSIVEEIILSLGRMRNLQVISPTTLFAYVNTPLSVEQIGLELGARYSVTTTIREVDDHLIISMRLIETKTARLVWADQYQCTRENLFTVQLSIVERIITALLGNIESAEYKRAQHMISTTWPAYELMNQGWQYLRSLDLGSIDIAKTFFHRSLEKDPNLARAYLGLALAHLREWACNSWNMWFFIPEVAENYAQKALELDQLDGRAHCILGLCQIYTGNHQLAEKRIEQALSLNPNDTDILAHSACALAILGDHPNALECADRALQLAPYRPDWYVSFAGFAYMTAGKYNEGIRVMSEAPEAVCDTPSYLATCYAHMGKIEESKQYADTLMRHYRRQIARGDYDATASCIDWILSMAPYRLEADRDHFLLGLKLAGLS
jgi:DNA-binding SARP family transcriptional activator/tetratricopeptide (TPR) repeat protein